MADCWEEDDWFIDFNRSLSTAENSRWLELKNLIADVSLSNNKDIVVWLLDKSQTFTTKSLYRFIIDRGAASKVAGCNWKNKMPLKIKFFLWQAFNNKLQVAQALTKRGWKGSANCCLRDGIENVDHMIFNCHIASYVWCF